MNREIRFRAKNKKTGEWFYWSARDCFDGAWQNMVDHEVDIDWDTSGVSSDLKDKNNKEIYEGDICRNGDWEPDAHAYNYRTEVIQYVEDEGSFIGWNPSIDCMTCEVIGNIYENPELLEP